MFNNIALADSRPQSLSTQAAQSTVHPTKLVGVFYQDEHQAWPAPARAVFPAVSALATAEIGSPSNTKGELEGGRSLSAATSAAVGTTALALATAVALLECVHRGAIHR